MVHICDYKWSKTSTESVIGHLNLRIKVEKSFKKNYHHRTISPIEGYFKVTKNLREHFCSKMHKIKPGLDSYQLLQLAKIHLPISPGLIEVSPLKYLERKYQCKFKDNVSENKDLCFKSKFPRKKLECDSIDYNAAAST